MSAPNPLTLEELAGDQAHIESPPPGLPRCPVAELAKLEDVGIYKARAEHLRCYQIAKREGLPLPDLDDFLPKSVKTTGSY